MKFSIYPVCDIAHDSIKIIITFFETEVIRLQDKVLLSFNLLNNIIIIDIRSSTFPIFENMNSIILK